MKDDSPFSDIVEQVLKVIEKLPNPPKESITNKFMELKEMMLDSRCPRLMIVGRRGSGKSSLINAIFNEKYASVGSIISETGASKWYNYKSQISSGALEILDTRGFGDKTRPESAHFEEAIDEIKYSLDEKMPDVILFLIKAADVDSHIEVDIKNLISIREDIFKKDNYKIPILGIITQVDQLDPARISEPPYEDEKKQHNISLALETLKKAFVGTSIELTNVIALSAYAEYDDNNKIVDSRYWNIDCLVSYLLETLPKEAQLQIARISKVKSVQKQFARTLIGTTASITAGIAATPIPIADIIPITSVQVGMIISIAYLSGRELSKDNAKDFLTGIGVNVGAAFVLREAARGIVKFAFPGAGNTISSIVAFAGTWALGEAAIAYYIDEKSMDEAKSILKNTFIKRNKKSE